VDATGLPPGFYSGSVRIQMTNSPAGPLSLRIIVRVASEATRDLTTLVRGAVERCPVADAVATAVDAELVPLQGPLASTLAAHGVAYERAIGRKDIGPMRLVSDFHSGKLRADLRTAQLLEFLRGFDAREGQDIELTADAAALLVQLAGAIYDFSESDHDYDRELFAERADLLCPINNSQCDVLHIRGDAMSQSLVTLKRSRTHGHRFKICRRVGNLSIAFRLPSQRSFADLVSQLSGGRLDV
jgi:hypothetical protein